MRLKKLTLSNFRGFEQIEIDFCDDFTVIAGVNGSGKSSLLKAISSIASYLLPKTTSAKKESFSLAESDIYSGKLALSISTTFKTEKQMLYSQILRSRSARGNTSDLTKELAELRVAKRFTEKGSKEEVRINEKMYNIDQLLKESKDNFSWHSEKDEVANSLIIYYSTNRSLSRLSKQTSKVRPLTPANAYSNALQEIEVSLNEFANWYRACENGLLGDEAIGLRLLKTLEAVIDTMMPSFSELLLVDKPTPHFTIKKNNTQFELDQLSEGERGILALAFDLTRRLTLANPQSQNPIEEGFALVMIDEIELHLHPKWQRQVLRRLTSIFKNCQFIVTTHSPQVIGQAPAENLRLLYLKEEKGKEKICAVTPYQALGMDSSWVLQNIMNCPARDYETEQKLSAIFDEIDKNELVSARQKINELLNEVGDFPDLQEASALLDRLELLEAYEED
jgi:predicted ATP-binding protein involved in virulence